MVRLIFPMMNLHVLSQLDGCMMNFLDELVDAEEKGFDLEGDPKPGMQRESKLSYGLDWLLF